jgi:hypothetical protein
VKIEDVRMLERLMDLHWDINRLVPGQHRELVGEIKEEMKIIREKLVSSEI